jgi:PilZ domain
MTDQERRSNLRVPFVAYAEIIEAGSSVTIAVRVSDLGNDGCYVDMRAPLAKGASVRIKVVAARDAFEAEATVAYVDPNLGMGLVFRSVRPGARMVLRKWLWEAEHEPQT